MRFLLVQHLAIEPASLIGEVIAAAGHECRCVDVERGGLLPASCDGYDGIVIMGGSMSANDIHLVYISDELRLLQHALEKDIPVLGICLGAQLLARAAGAEVVRLSQPELGWYPLLPTAASAGDPLFASLPAAGLDVFQWHGETFGLPAGATLLATGSGVPNQAFSIGSSQYGLQFHIEVDRPIIESWVMAGESERAVLGEHGVNRIRAESGEKLPAAHYFCHAMVMAWLSLAAGRG